MPCSHIPTKFQEIDTKICWCVQSRTTDLVHTRLQEQLTELTKNFCQSVQKQRQEEGKQKKRR